jgi:hypothetical protein
MSEKERGGAGFATPSDGEARERLVAEEFERWKKARWSPSESERQDAHRYFVNAWAMVAWLAEARRDAMGRELAKLQARIHRQRVANREVVRGLLEAEADNGRLLSRLSELEGEVESYRLTYEVMRKQIDSLNREAESGLRGERHATEGREG